MDAVHHRAFLPACCLIAFGLATYLALGPLDGAVHVSDELAYVLQARLFGAGLRTGPAAAHPALEAAAFWVTGPRSHGVFPVGWPLLLAPLARLGLEHLANPLLAGTLPVLGWLALRERLEETEARWAALVLALTPGVSVLAASVMSQTSVLVALTGALAVVIRARDRLGFWALAGVALGYVVLARPFDGLLLAGPLAVLGLALAPNHRSRLVLLAPLPLAAALTLADNAALTGHALRFPSTVWLEADAGRPGCNALGFGAELGCRPTLGSFGHTPAKALQTAAISLERLERLILGLPGGGLVVLAGLGLGRRRVGWLLPLLAVPLVGYLVYWSPGAAYGARFLHPAQLLVAAALGVVLARFRLAPSLLGAAALLGHGLVAQDLRGYWCVSVPPVLGTLERGLLLVSQHGTTDGWYPSLRVGLACEPPLAFTGPRGRHDPTGEGLQVLRLPEDRADYIALVEGAQGPVHVLVQDLASGTSELTRLRD